MKRRTLKLKQCLTVLPRGVFEMSDLAKLARKEKKEKVQGHEISIMPLGATDLDLFEKEDKTREEA